MAGIDRKIRRQQEAARAKEERSAQVKEARRRQQEQKKTGGKDSSQAHNTRMMALYFGISAVLFLILGFFQNQINTTIRLILIMAAVVLINLGFNAWQANRALRKAQQAEPKSSTKKR